MTQDSTAQTTKFAATPHCHLRKKNEKKAWRIRGSAQAFLPFFAPAMLAMRRVTLILVSRLQRVKHYFQ